MNTDQYLIQTSVSQRLIIKALRIKQVSANYTVRSSSAIVSLFMLISLVTLVSIDASAGLIDNIKADMQSNEAPLLNVLVDDPRPWLKQAMITMGSAPRGDATPTKWDPANSTLTTSSPWKAITPWFVLSPAVGNAAKNVRVKVFGINVHVLDKSTNTWKRLDTGSFGNTTWARNKDYSGGTTVHLGVANSRTEPDGTISYKINSSSNAIHGGAPMIDLTKYINPKNVAAVFVHFKTQLILDNLSGVDDRALAKILINVAADYYPEVTSVLKDFHPVKYAPPVGSSRFGLVKTYQRSHYMTTIDPPGPPKPISEYLLNGGEVAIPAAQFEANMPPYLFDTIAPSTPTSLSLIFNKATTTAWASNNLSWHNSTDNLVVAGYNIYRDGKLIAKSSSNYYKDSFPMAGTGTTYTYSVRAFDSAGNLSATSNFVMSIY